MCYSRCKYTDKNQDCLGVQETLSNLSLVERLVLNSSLITGYTFNGNEAFPVAEESSVGRCIRKYEPDDKSPDASNAPKLIQTSVLRLSIFPAKLHSQ